MTGLDLHDGDTYYMNLIVCNGAQICIETKSDGILVDTSPPTSGMYICFIMYRGADHKA